MGNGLCIKSMDCCNPKGNQNQGEIDVNNSGNTKSIDLINKDNNPNQNIIKTKSRISSKSESIKNEEEIIKSPPLVINNINTFSELKLNENQVVTDKKIKYNNSIKHIKADTKLIISGELFYNKVIEINENGMKNGYRRKTDGIAIFGAKNENDEINLDNDIILCDFFLNLKKIYHNEPIFKIYYDKNKKTYILYFIHNSLILYYKISNKIFFEVDKDYFIILADVFLTINVDNINENEKQIKIQIEIENEKSKNYTFKQNEMPIKIGRSDCNINIQRHSISKIHCFIGFENNTFYYKDAESTNGSSLLIREDDYIDIKGEMSFKLETYSFKIKEVPNELKN
jgi:hypothetical protein